jgi:antitoxin ParD1/3/4
MATSVHLTPELERLARKCVKSGRFNDVSDVVRSGLRLLQVAEERRRRFMKTLEEAEEEADCDGTITLESVLAELDEIIESSKR